MDIFISFFKLLGFGICECDEEAVNETRMRLGGMEGG